MSPKPGRRRRRLAELMATDAAVILYESPFRITKLLADIADIDSNRRVVVGRELTKLHEEITEGTAQEVLDEFWVNLLFLFPAIKTLNFRRKIPIIKERQVMMIDKISGVNPLNNVQNTKRTNATASIKAGNDSISVSDEAKKLSDAYYLKQVAEETPDVRTDLVEQIKQKIKDPNYLSSATIEATADRILAAYGF